MEFRLTYCGIPIGLAESQDARGLSVVRANPLAALEAIRLQLPEWPERRVTAIGARGFSERVEWRDAHGAAVPAVRVDVWLSEDQLLVFTAFDPLGAGVPAVMPSHSTLGSGEADG
jgi:hypothetical protein